MYNTASLVGVIGDEDSLTLHILLLGKSKIQIERCQSYHYPHVTPPMLLPYYAMFELKLYRKKVVS